MAGLMCFADGSLETPPESNAKSRAEFCAVHLLTFMVISRCCSPVVEIALKSSRSSLDAGYQAWQFITSTYQVTDDLYIGQLEEQMTHLRMVEQETATDYYNWARRLLASMQMAGVDYLTASYITHVVKGLPSSYNIMRRLLMVPGTRESLNEDTLTSYILRDEAMQEAKRSTELLQQANYATPTKQGSQQGQRGKPGGGGSGGGRSAKDADKAKSTKDGGQGGGGLRRECCLCGDPDHLSIECLDRDDSDDNDTKGGQGSKGRGEGEVSCLLIDVVEPTVSLAPEAGEDFQAVAAAMQANSAVVLLDSGCWHHLMGTKEVFVDLGPSGDVKHVCCFNGALQTVQGRGTIALQGEAGKQVLIPDVLYILGVQANLLSAGQLQESGARLQDNGVEMLLVSAAGDVLSRAKYTGRVLCTDLRPCTPTSKTATTETVALRTIATVTKSTPARWHMRLAQVGVDTITSLAKYEVATGLNVQPSAGTNSPCVSCVGRKLARHTFPDKGLDADEALVVKWLLVAERQTNKSVLMMRSDCRGGFLGKAFTDFVDGKSIVHNLTYPYTPQKNSMAEQEMRTVVELVRAMLLQMGVQHHWWHLALRKTVWVRTCLERSTLPLRTTPYQLLTNKKHNLTLKCVEVLDLIVNRVVTTSDVVFYDTMLLEGPPERLTYHVCLPPAAFTTLLHDADADVDLHELGPDMHTEPEHRWHIAAMTLVKRPRRVNVMKNRWVLMTKYHVDDTVAREKARLVVKGFMQLYGTDYDETYAPVSNYVTLMIFLSIVAVLNLNLVQLDMKNTFLQSKLDRVLYMYQPDYYDDGTVRVCKLLKSLYRLKQSLLL
ncbi:unnamed protein product [Closterium sp. NIES-54]